MKKELYDLIQTKDNIVFFGGAGVSTESGVPDFRSSDGLYSGKQNYPPELLLSHNFFFEEPDIFFKFYKDSILHLDAKPNQAHLQLAKLEEQGKLRQVITQNIDGLHQLAGSKNVIELHGSVHRNYCLDCEKEYDARYMKDAEGLPRCTCKGVIKPDVVLYQESLNQDDLQGSIQAIAGADLLIIGGTSLSVYPAASLINYYKGKDLVIINKSPTSQDQAASLVIQENIGEVFDWSEFE